MPGRARCWANERCKRISTNEYFLYGSDVSLYAGKARSYLRKKGVPFEMRSTSHPGHARAIAAIGHAYQPILETAAGEFVQDTTEIIDFIEPRHPAPSVYPSGPCQRLVALLLELAACGAAWWRSTETAGRSLRKWHSFGRLGVKAGRLRAGPVLGIII